MKIENAMQDIKKDPRFSAKQRQTLAACIHQDRKGEILGLDKKGRPVVEVEVGIPRQKRMWSITKAGDPADIVWEDRDLPHTLRNLAEPWDDSRG